MLLGRRVAGLTRVLVIPSAIFRPMVEHFESELPRESAAILWGGEGVAAAWTPVTNVAHHDHEFRMDPAEFECALASSTSPLLAFAHSHPTEPAIPSGADLAGAADWTRVLHLIVSFEHGHPRARAWRLFDGQALPEPVRIAEEDRADAQVQGGNN